jgi:cytochrome c biogenesis protein CcmG, thiol:disulfide interchange protein DsbE
VRPLNRERIWRGVLWGAASLALVLGAVEAVREERMGTALPSGTPPPPFTATRVDGAPFTLSEVKGKVVLLSFWATWCEACSRERPMLQALSAEYRSRGVELVAASLDEEDARKEAVAAFREALVVFPQGPTGSDWHAGTLPTLYVLGRDGRIVSGHSGIASEAAVKSAIDEALKGL